MVRLFGCGLLVLMFVLMGWVVEYYVEVWNLFEVWQFVVCMLDVCMLDVCMLVVYISVDVCIGKSVEKYVSVVMLKVVVKLYKCCVVQVVKVGLYCLVVVVIDMLVVLCLVVQLVFGCFMVMQFVVLDVMYVFIFFNILC